VLSLNGKDMPEKGQILENPATGDVYEFIETAKDTGGAEAIFKVILKSKGKYVPDHIHALQQETFEVISGALTVFMNGETKVLTAGEKIILPANKAHNHFNTSEVPVKFLHKVSPALDFDYLVENLVKLSIDGKMHNGKAGFIQELVTLKYLDSKTFLADIPVGIQKALMNTIGPIGRLFGYRAVYKKYSGIEK
jgi:quercetin dioxygenase-like cupin family protein